MTTPPFVDHFATIADRYDVLLCDVWGVIHNGVAAFPEAVDALTRFRARGGRAILITNAPRPSSVVIDLLDGMKVPHEAYDAIVSSGDVTREVVTERVHEGVFHLGPPRDLPLFENLPVRFVGPEHADYVVCSGLFDDETEAPEDYDDLLSQLLARKLFMICANPDVVVERGNTLVYCAGAIADRYAGRGGNVLFAGKPHAPIYQAALARAGVDPARREARSRVLAIGDSVRTDITGAVQFGVDALFITAGIHAEELGTRDRPDADRLGAVFAKAGVTPQFVAARLAW